MEKELKKLKEQPRGGASQVDLNDTFGNKSLGIDISPLKSMDKNTKDATPQPFPGINLGSLLNKK